MRLQGDRALGRLVSAVLSGGVQKTVRTLVYRPAARYDNGPGFSSRLRRKGKAVRLRLTNRQLFEKSWTKNFHALRDIHF